MICRLRINTGHGVIEYSAIGDPKTLEDAARKAFGDVPCGVTVMVLR